MIKQLAHLCIHTGDLDGTENFYLDALGLEPGFNFERAGRRFGFYLKLGAGTFIEVFEGERNAPGTIDHFAIEVDDLDAVIARLRRHGIEVTEKKLGADHSWQAWLADPNGVRIELHEYTPESLQRLGGTCVVDW